MSNPQNVCRNYRNPRSPFVRTVVLTDDQGVLFDLEGKNVKPANYNCSGEYRHGRLVVVDEVPIASCDLQHYSKVLLAKYLHKALRFTCRQVAQFMELDAGYVSKLANTPLPTRERVEVELTNCSDLGHDQGVRIRRRDVGKVS